MSSEVGRGERCGRGVGGIEWRILKGRRVEMRSRVFVPIHRKSVQKRWTEKVLGHT